MKKKSLSNKMRSLHRDLGYFFIGITLIYSITGFVLSARGLGWFKSTYNFQINISTNISTDKFKNILIDEAKNGNLNEIYTIETYKIVERNINRLKFIKEEGDILYFYNNKNLNIKYNKLNGLTKINYKDYSPLLRAFISSHLTREDKPWFFLALIYSVVLGFFAVSAIFMVKGKYGFKKRGIYLSSLGILTIIVFLYFSVYV